MSYGVTAELLQDVLPIAEALAPCTSREHVFTIAERLEQQLEWAFIDSCPAESSCFSSPMVRSPSASMRDLQLYLNPHAEHLLDWFHDTMRLTILQQTAKGLPDQTKDEEANYPLRDPVVRDLERLKWYLWHGNVHAVTDAAGAAPPRSAHRSVPVPGGRRGSRRHLWGIMPAHLNPCESHRLPPAMGPKVSP